MKRLLLAIVSGAALWTAACSGGSNIAPPPPTGKYSLASLKGTYAFVTSGEVFDVTNGVELSLVRTGSFTADGTGAIKTGGVYDLVEQGGISTTAAVPVSITGGSYTINADGRGSLTLNVTSNGGPTTVSFGIVLTSTSDGLMIDETTSANQASTGSGNFILQNTGAFQLPTISGSYVFDFSGLDGNPNGPMPESLVGQLSANGGGQITSGVADLNDGLALSSGVIVGGPFTIDPVYMATSGRGTVTIEGQSYAFYIVDSTRVRFISINAGGTGPMLSGDAVSQSNIPANVSAFNGGFVYLLSGSDAGGNGFTRVGRFTATGNAPSKMLMDANDGGTFFQFNSNNLKNGTISYDGMTGRGQLSFVDQNGNTDAFVFYLSSQSSGVIQDVSPSNIAGVGRIVADGSIEAQSGGPFSSSNITGTYAMNWSGLVTGGGGTFQDEEDIVSQLKVSSLSLSGTSDVFQFTSGTLTPVLDVGTGGTITINGDGTGDDGNRVDMNVKLSSPTPVDMVVYIVSPQLAFFENRDNNGGTRIDAGILETQQ
jgi:hypothetical protein